MKKLIVISALVVIAAGEGSSAVAEAPDEIVLWGDITTATTKAEAKAFRAALPGKRVEVIPGCPAPFGYRTQNGTLVTVTFMAQDRDANCHRRLLEIFLTELGEPEVGSVTFGSVIGNGSGGSLDMTSEGVKLVWREGEKKTKLIKTPGNGYNLIFTVRDDKYLY